MGRKKIAAINTIYHKFSHAQHIVDRFLEGYGWQGGHHMPPFELASMYIDQIGDDDLGKERCDRFGVPLYPTIAEALTLGGEKLAVDGVLLIGEHGKYDSTDKGQRKYPRHDFFMQITAVFRDSGRAVPVFNDKHLSYDWGQAVEMYDVSRELGFAFMAGSSLPVTWRIPELEFPIGVDVREATCVGYGGVDSYDFHGLETVQCMVERRGDGEVGVANIQAIRGEAAWETLEDGRVDPELFWAAVSRSHTRKPKGEDDGDFRRSMDALRAHVSDPVVYLMEYVDGLKASMFLASGFVEDFNFAARLGDESVASTQMYLPMPPKRASLASFFSPLVYNVERMFVTGVPTYPLERTLLTTGQTAFAVDSLHDDGARLDTPELAIAYDAPRGSHFWRD
jgi:hypothetical protein